VVLELMFIGKH